MQASDEMVIQRVIDGDREAFNEIYERYFPRVMGFVRKRIDNGADVEETVQEVFINIFSSLDSYRVEAPFAAWVFGVSRRTVASRFKRKNHKMISLEGSEEPVDVGANVRREPTPLEYYERNERAKRLDDAAHQDLTPEQQRLFELHHLRHRPIQEIAQQLHKSEDAVKSHLYRARRLLLAR
ncbi:MAG: RNA polymerase sigma factor [Deltaproteobacteria bacterium]|nr:RNA polymerase sigma factor [Deltaproteobacteria bacterium]MBW2360164.1 RNA polymerase sigma factor [Deltaproteobacteria bacterium]